MNSRQLTPEILDSLPLPIPVRWRVAVICKAFIPFLAKKNSGSTGSAGNI